MANLTFYSNPQSRAEIVRWILEEIGAPYTVETVGYGETMKAEAFRAINPMMKVPAIRHGETVVTEAAAICAYLADTFPAAGLAPPTHQRGAYYRWLFFAAGPLEAALVDAGVLKVTPTPEQGSSTGYGSLARVVTVLRGALRNREFIAGDSFSAADVYVASHCKFAVQFGGIEPFEEIESYQLRHTSRPAYQRAQAAIAKELEESRDAHG